jgi:hypothetical protein
MMSVARRRAPSVVLVALSFLAVSCGGNVSSEGPTSTQVVETTAGSAQAPVESQAPSDSNTSGNDESADRKSDLEVVDSGFSTYLAYSDTTQASWAVIVRNPNSETWIASSIDVTVTFLDADGGLVHSESSSISMILPSQDAAVAASTIDDVSGAVSMRVQVRAGSWERSDVQSFGSFSADQVTLRKAEFGGWSVLGLVGSTFANDATDVYATAVLRDVNGAVLGGEWTFVNFIPARSDTSFNVSVTPDIRDAASAEVYFSLSYFSLPAS